ncbi:MAG: serine hydrolase domain-containing protein, partial [Ilumatobacteraceae bacterium]
MNALSTLVEAVVERPEAEGRTLALLVMKDGATEIEWYGTSPTTLFGGGERVTEVTTLISWSMAKSITHALLGIATVDGLLDVDDPAPFAALQAEGQPPMRWIDLLEMRSGLTFVEDYEDASVSHCLEMLFSGEEHRGVADMGMYAATLGREFRPGEHWSYASGTTNILCRMLGDILAGGDVASVGAEKRKNAIEQFAKERLFGPIGASSPIMKFDATGTFVGSSFVYATARDFASFGELYRRGGALADGTQILPVGWHDHARHWVAHDPEGSGPHGFDYGRHWWMWPDFKGSLVAQGFQGQYIFVLPEAGITMVHLGITDSEVA